jgi:hypothetical protein
MLRNAVSKSSGISISLGLLALAALAAIMPLALMPRAAQAYGGVPFKGTFSVAASVTPNTGGVTYCNGTAHALAVEAHGVGYSTLGALSLSLQKTIDVPGDMHGCLILTAPNGDTLNAIYDGTEDAPNANNFIVSATGTLTFTEGTGRFRNASGSAHFTGDFSTIYPVSSFLGGTTAPAQVMAFYSVEGTVLLHDGHDDDR